MLAIYLLIVAVLVYIGYQLFVSNELKKTQLIRQEERQEEERMMADIKEQMPHLNKKHLNDGNMEVLGNFWRHLKQSGGRGLDLYGPLEQEVEDKRHEEYKEVMKDNLEKIKRSLDLCATNLLPHREITQMEKLFLYWLFVEKHRFWLWIRKTDADYSDELKDMVIGYFPEKK